MGLGLGLDMGMGLSGLGLSLSLGFGLSLGMDTAMGFLIARYARCWRAPKWLDPDLQEKCKDSTF